MYSIYMKHASPPVNPEGGVLGAVTTGMRENKSAT